MKAVLLFTKSLKIRTRGNYQKLLEMKSKTYLKVLFLCIR